jgi:hypothetical protein
VGVQEWQGRLVRKVGWRGVPGACWGGGDIGHGSDRYVGADP